MSPMFKDEYEFEDWQDRTAADIYGADVRECSCCGDDFEVLDGLDDDYTLCLTCETAGCREDGMGMRCID